VHVDLLDPVGIGDRQLGDLLGQWEDRGTVVLGGTQACREVCQSGLLQGRHQTA